MSAKKKVSVIMSAYNAERFIGEAIQSALDQTYPNLEVIVCDDGSTDRTAEVVKSFGNRVTYIYQSNRGQGAGRNNAAQRATGEYLAFLDADDLWEAHKIEKQIEVFSRAPDVGAVYSGMNVIDSVGRLLPSRTRPPMKRGEVFSDLIAENFVGLSSLMVKRTVFDDVGGFSDHRYCQDFVMSLSIARSYKIDFVDEPLAFYRVHEAGLTNNPHLAFGETIEYFQHIPDEFNLSAMEEKIWRNQLKKLYVSYALLTLKRGERGFSLDIARRALEQGYFSPKLAIIRSLTAVHLEKLLI
jgi:glycosyltransferase involved in cell wall biosynthesis